MPILDIQQRFRELGRIRLGKREATGKTYSSGPRKGQTIERPVKLATFRLTSPWRHLIEAAAELFGGEARPWDNDGTAEWEVLTTNVGGDGIALLPVLIPPGEILDQWYELWSGGGCQKRCDGIRQVLKDAACTCPKDPAEREREAKEGRACKATTRLRVMLPELPDMGTWRLESHGFYAAAELGQAAGLVELATRRGAIVPADLRLVKREGARRPGEPRKSFFVPALSFRGTLGQTLDALGLLEAGGDLPEMLGSGVERRPALDAGARPELPAAGQGRDGLEAPRPEPRTEPPPLDGVGRPQAPVEPASIPEPTVEAPPTTPAPPDADAGAMAQAQAVAMRCRDQGVDRALLISAVTGGRISSAKELTADEASEVFAYLYAMKRGELELVDGPAGPKLLGPTEAVLYRESSPPPTTSPPSSPAPEAAEEPERVTPEVVSSGPSSSGNPVAAPGRTAAAERWDAAGWRTFLAERGVKVTELLREANRLAREDGDPPPTTLDALVADGSAAVKGLLVGYVEDLAASRSTS